MRGSYGEANVPFVRGESRATNNTAYLLYCRLKSEKRVKFFSPNRWRAGDRLLTSTQVTIIRSEPVNPTRTRHRRGVPSLHNSRGRLYTRPLQFGGRGGIGRRAALRSLWDNTRGSSSLLDRTRFSLAVLSCQVEYGDLHAIALLWPIEPGSKSPSPAGPHWTGLHMPKWQIVVSAGPDGKGPGWQPDQACHDGHRGSSYRGKVR